MGSLFFEPCDECGHRSFVQIFLPVTGGELVWCGHHAAIHLPLVRAIGAVIFDRRDEILGAH